MAKHFALTITEDSCHVARKSEAVADEARLDGIYVLRTSLPAKHTDTAAAPQG
jgi:hypothetical protein